MRGEQLERECRKCGGVKLLDSDNFHRDRRDLSGYVYICKICKNTYNRERKRKIKEGTWVYMSPVPGASISPKTTDLYWAAGFLEGEGTFRNRGGSHYISAAQTHRSPIEKLRDLFGGRIYEQTRKTKGWKTAWFWNINGARARGVMMTLYGIIVHAEKKSEIKEALNYNPLGKGNWGIPSR